MEHQPIRGFPLPDDFASTRIPNVILGRVMANIDDVEVVKLILRALWLLERQIGYPRYITTEDLKRDRVLSVTFRDVTRLNQALTTVLQLGVLTEASIRGMPCLMLNTESAMRATFRESDADTNIDSNTDSSDGWDSPASSHAHADAFRAYEENIGFLSPMIRESILEALEDFTDDDITRAIRIAVENGSRSWAFVNGVLRRWSREGIPYEHRSGETGGERDNRRISQDELRKYLEQQRKRIRTRTESE